MLTFIFIDIIIVMSLNLTIGFTGLVNLGHMVFFGIGAYTSAILTLNGVPWYYAMVMSAVITSIFGIIVAVIIVRLKGDYLAMVTLGLVFVAIALSRNWISLTRGALGLPGVPDIMNNNLYYMIFTLGITTISIIFFYKFTNSETGKILQAIRDDEIATATLGKNTFFYKVLSIGTSTFFVGIAGSLFVHHLNFVDPTIFDLEFFLIIISMLIVGGLASIKGSIIGVFILFTLSESIRLINIDPNWIHLLGAVREMMFAFIIIIILILRPRGMYGKVDV